MVDLRTPSRTRCTDVSGVSTIANSSKKKKTKKIKLPGPISD
jgi:hypothetical protein